MVHAQNQVQFFSKHDNSYQLGNRRLKFCFYILVENGLNVLFSICIFSERGYICANIYKSDDHSVS